MDRKQAVLYVFITSLSLAFDQVSSFNTVIPNLPLSISSTLVWMAKNEKNLGQSNDTEREDNARQLLARAKAIRDSLPQEEKKQTLSNEAPLPNLDYPNQGDKDVQSRDYRLYVNIGREDGTWMDVRWGASGGRIEFTIDVSFLVPLSAEAKENSEIENDDDLSLAGPDIIENMVNDNLLGKRSTVRILRCAPTARLRSGFDKMNCNSGGYRIDGGGGNSLSQSTLRFYLEVDGTAEKDGTYGDVWIPKGRLYFALPCFGSGVDRLSTKEGVASVRQVGWHTGWRREESRILGVFRATPLDDARKRDKF